MYVVHVYNTIDVDQRYYVHTCTFLIKKVNSMHTSHVLIYLSFALSFQSVVGYKRSLRWVLRPVSTVPLPNKRRHGKHTNTAL
jgi:hypothetical protein